MEKMPSQTPTPASTPHAPEMSKTAKILDKSQFSADQYEDT